MPIPMQVFYKYKFYKSLCDGAPLYSRISRLAFPGNRPSTSIIKDVMSTYLAPCTVNSSKIFMQIDFLDFQGAAPIFGQFQQGDSYTLL